MKRQKWLCGVLAFLMLCTVLPINVASAAEPNQYQVTMQMEYGQTEARNMVTYLNQFRTGADAWAWNKDNSKKETYSGLSRLTYDYNLEKIAMQRAAEIALNFAHKRPNGQSYNTLTEGGTRSRAESIATGHSSAKETFRQLKADGEAYSGQGYRRNMLDSGSKAVGIGHVALNGKDFWALEFGSGNSGAGETAAKNGKADAAVPVASNMMRLGGISVPESLEIAPGATVTVPTATVYYRLPDTVYWDLLSMNMDPQWKVANGAIASLSGKTLQGVAAGKTKLEGSVMGLPVSVAVTVGQRDGWYQDSHGWYLIWYGEKLKNRWAMDSHDWMYLGADGYAVTDSWVQDSHDWMCLDSNGYPVRWDWRKDSHDWRCLGADGYPITNAWIMDSHDWMYLDSNGYPMRCGWAMDSHDWMCVGWDGYPIRNGWAMDSHGWMYLGSEGYPMKNMWADDSGGTCYVDENGYMVTNTTITDENGTHEIDENGHLVK